MGEWQPQPGRGDKALQKQADSQNGPFSLLPTPLPNIMPCSFPRPGCVLGPSLGASAPWSCPWAEDRVTVTRQPLWEQHPPLGAGGWGPVLPVPALPAHRFLAIPAAPGGTTSGWHCTNVTLSMPAVAESCKSTSPSSSTWGQRGGSELWGAWQRQH